MIKELNKNTGINCYRNLHSVGNPENTRRERGRPLSLLVFLGYLLDELSELFNLRTPPPPMPLGPLLSKFLRPCLCPQLIRLFPLPVLPLPLRRPVLATFVSVLHDPSVGVAIAIAVAIHNIPEGIAVSVPVYYATGDKQKAFLYSFLSGLSEPLGALIGYLILLPFMSEALFALLFASVAGIMVFISLDELLPAAREYGQAHHSVYGIIAGMMVMAISLLLT